MIINLKGLEDLAPSDLSLQFGCVVDTRVLFGAAHPADRLHAWAEKFFQLCHVHSIPVYTNLNNRFEFMDLFRRALVIESLVMLQSKYSLESKEKLAEGVETQLKALEDRIRKDLDANRSTELNENEIRAYRRALLSVSSKKTRSGLDLWQLLCSDFLEPQLRTVWEDTTRALGMKVAGSRAIESSILFLKPPGWDGATEIMGRAGIDSAGAMIVNFFACSKFSLLVTADAQAAEYAQSILPARKVLLPQEGEFRVS